MVSLTRLLILLPLLLVSSGALASPIHDPWLARFQVGDLREPDAYVLDEIGWPEGLLDPLVVDPGFVAGARRVFHDDSLPRHPEQTAWRLAVPMLDGADAANEAYARTRRQAGLLLELGSTGTSPPAADLPRQGPWALAIHQLQASRQWQGRAWAAAAATCRALLSLPSAASLDPSARLVWTMREVALRERSGEVVGLESVWRSLPDLGAYDTRSGWALWLSLRRGRGQPALAPDQATRATGQLLADAGRLFLTAEQLWSLGLPSEATAGLGARMLPGSRLGEHFDRYPDLPDDGRWQGYWLRGQRRRDGGPAAIERLARLAGLKDGHRLDLWRRASEARLLRTEWPQGLANLDSALALWHSDASRWMRGRLREWSVQALALALAERRTGDARTVVAKVERHLAGTDLAEFRGDAGALLARLEGTPLPADVKLREGAEARVRAGLSPDVGSLPRLGLPSAEAWRDRLWLAWAAWGLSLLDESHARNQDQLDYGQALRYLEAQADPVQRHATACALAASRLRGSAAVPALLAYAWHRDVEQASGGRALPRATPIPDLLEPAPWRGLDQQLRGHALLGLAIALGDDRGLIAAAVRLPAGGLPDRLYRLFWYPVPADPGLRTVLDETTLPAELLLAIARNESLFEPAVRSRAGALGAMQIMPFHYADPAGSPGDGHWSHPATSFRAGARILSSEVRAFAGDPYRAVAAYNAGRGAVKRWVRQLGQVPDRDLFWAWIGYPETRQYVLRVLRDREVYRRLLDPGP